MKQMISVSVEKESIKEMGTQIGLIFKNAHAYHIDQSTILKSLEVLQSLGPTNTIIQHCMFYGDTEPPKPK